VTRGEQNVDNEDGDERDGEDSSGGEDEEPEYHRSAQKQADLLASPALIAELSVLTRGMKEILHGISEEMEQQETSSRDKDGFVALRGNMLQVSCACVCHVRS
jgi:hypothetical protein